MKFDRHINTKGLLILLGVLSGIAIVCLSGYYTYPFWDKLLNFEATTRITNETLNRLVLGSLVNMFWGLVMTLLCLAGYQIFNWLFPKNKKQLGDKK